MKKVTQKMIDNAENAHFRSETYSSLIKAHALKAIYYKQQGKHSIARKFITSPEVRRKVAQLESAKPPKKRRKSRGLFNSNIRMPRGFL